MQGLTDTHTHLSYLSGKGIANDCIDNLFNEGFGFMLDIGTRAGDLAGRVKCLSCYNNVRFACGIWPHREFLDNPEENAAKMEKDIDGAPESLVVAIGECGFDKRENPQFSCGEERLLELQLDIAARKCLPVIIHSRDAPEQTIAALSRFPSVHGVIHCFSYTGSEAKTFLDMGYYISFAGNLTYKNAHNLRSALLYIPQDRLLLETDCPYLAPSFHRGKVCHPGMIIETYKAAAEILKIDIIELKRLIAENARKLFRVDTQA
jgi:TatD DNase family protein